MLDLVSAVHGRIQQQAGRLFAKVGEVADLAALEALPRVFPVAYVLPGSESGEPAPQIRQQTQAHAVVVEVVYVTRVAGDASGARAVAGLHPLREAVQDAIVGWTPPESGGNRIQFVRGALTSAEDGVIVWTDSFAVRRLVTRTPDL